MTTQYLAEDIERFEGLKLKAYKDDEGNWTIGIGHNLQADPSLLPQLAHLIAVGISSDQAQALELKDVAAVKTEFDLHIPWWRTMSDPRQDVFVQLGFNMGVGDVLRFPHMLAAAQNGDFDGPDGAAVELQRSDWFGEANQDQDRGTILVEQLRSGVRVAPA